MKVLGLIRARHFPGFSKSMMIFLLTEGAIFRPMVTGRYTGATSRFFEVDDDVFFYSPKVPFFR